MALATMIFSNGQYNEQVTVTKIEETDKQYIITTIEGFEWNIAKEDVVEIFSARKNANTAKKWDAMEAEVAKLYHELEKLEAKDEYEDKWYDVKYLKQEIEDKKEAMYKYVDARLTHEAYMLIQHDCCGSYEDYGDDFMRKYKVEDFDEQANWEARNGYKG